MVGMLLLFLVAGLLGFVFAACALADRADAIADEAKLREARRRANHGS